MYSYSASARGSTGKRGHGGRPYRAPPDRSKQAAKPPPLKACDCLIELDVPEYLSRAASHNQPLSHATWGGRDAMAAMVRNIRSKYQCHLQIPGRNQVPNPVALVAATVMDALPACQYLMQQIKDTTTTLMVVRIRTSVKRNLPVITGRLHQVTGVAGCLFDSTDWAVAVLTQLEAQLQRWQTCLDNLAFTDSSFQLQMYLFEDQYQYAFAMGSPSSVDKLLSEFSKAMGKSDE